MRLIPRFWIPALALLLGAPVSAAPNLVRTLPNKVTVLAREVRTRPIVSLQAWMRVGGRDESPSEHGVSSVLAEEMFDATATRERGQMEKEITSIGGTLGIETGYGFTIYTITVPAQSLGLAVDCMSDALMHTKMDDHFLEQGIAKARHESQAALGTAERASINTVRAALWSGTPLATPFAVPELEINSIPASIVQRFYREHYIAENLTIVAVGDVDSEDLAARVDRAFADMPHGRAAATSPVKASAFAGPKTVVQKDPAGTSGQAVTIGFRAPPWGSADALALDVLLALLVDSPDARLQTRLGDKAPDFTQASAYRTFEADGGSMTISLSAVPGRMADAEGVLLGEIEKVKSTPISADELDSAVRTVLARDLLPRTELGALGRATALASFQGKPGADEVYSDRLRAIRPADLVAVARKYLDVNQSAFVEMAPDSVLKASNESGDLGRRIGEKASIARAAYQSGPSVSASPDADRRARIDAPLAKIPATPLDSGRGRVDRTVLAGGLRLLTGEDWSAPLATVGVYMLGGVRYETDDNNGITALAEEVLLNCDDPKHPGSTYRMSLQKLGRLVPYQDRDMWGYSISVPSWSVAETIALLGDMLTHAKIDTVSVDASRIAVLTAFDRWWGDDQTQRNRLIFPTKYQVSGYRLPGLGNRKNLMVIPQTDVEAFYRKFVVRSNLVVAVFGAVRSADAKAAVTESFRDVPDRPFSPGTITHEGDFTNFRELWELGGGPECTVTLAFGGPKASSPEMPTMYVINSLISGPKGWFAQFVLQMTGIRSATSIVAQAVDESPVIASVTTDNMGNEELGAKLLFRQFKKVALLPLVGDLAPDLVNAKRHAIGSYLMLFTSNTGRAFQWVRAELFGLGPDYPLTLAAKMDAVGSDDLTSVGLKYFQKDDWNRQPYAICETRPGGW
jgi:zinc protease